MKKVLIITNIAHAKPRIPYIAKYLPEFGWEPIILTPIIKEKNTKSSFARFFQKDKIKEVSYLDILNRIIETLKKKLGVEKSGSVRRHTDKRFGVDSPKSVVMKSLIKLFKEVFYYPDQDRAWKTPAINQAAKILNSESIDAIISSSSPVTSHIIARKLKDKYKLPWIADLRDLWSQNHNYPYRSLRLMFDRRLELRTLSTAESLVTVSRPLENKLKKFHTGKKVYTITNGYDPDDLNKTDRNILTTNFTITYTGQIYHGSQDPSKLFQALQDLISEGIIKKNDVEVRFYGFEESWLEREIKKYRLSDIVKQLGWIPRRVAIEKQRESQLLLSLNNENPNEKGAYSLKIFEYLAAKRPILATGGFGDDVKEKLLNQTKAGFYVKGVEEIKDTLKKIYLDYKENGKISFNGNNEEIKKYSYREMAKKFVKILE